MNIEALIREIAQTWHEGGGDAMGFWWCQDRIRAAVRELGKPAASTDVPK